MIDIEYLRKGKRLEAQTVAHKGTLEVPHTTLATLDTATKRIDGGWRQTVDAATDVFGRITTIKKSGDAKRLIGRHVERLLIINIVGEWKVLI